MSDQRYAASGGRLGDHIEALARFNATPGRGITRFSYSEQDRGAREYLMGKMEEVGLEVRVDPIGNIRGRLEGSTPGAAPVLAGSHIDTVLYGGRYDGVVGVVCALEALTVFRERGFTPSRPLEMIVFVEEEGVNFGSGMAGSRALVGLSGVETMKQLVNEDGVSMYEAAAGAGFDPDSMPRRLIAPGDVHAMLEIHIEQSLVLDTERIPVGIVTGIAGMKRLRIRIDGQPNHAGATPMRYRRDPMAGAALVISAVEEAAAKKALPTTVGTVGKVVCSPNVINVIPQSVEVFVDTRDVDPKGMETVVSTLQSTLDRLTRERGLTCRMDTLGEIEPTLCSKRVVDALQGAAEQREIPFMRMTSGALHDAAVLAGVTDIGMLFVPSKDGRSHVPEEQTDLDDIRKGCDVLIGALVELTLFCQ